MEGQWQGGSTWDEDDDTRWLTWQDTLTGQLERIKADWQILRWRIARRVWRWLLGL